MIEKKYEDKKKLLSIKYVRTRIKDYKTLI